MRLALAILKGPSLHFADTAEYDQAARAILLGHAPPAGLPRAPLYPAFMAAVYAWFGAGNFAAVRFVQLGIGTAIVVLTATLARRVAGGRAAVIAACVAAFAPTLVYTSTMLYPSALYTMLLLVATIAARALVEVPRARVAVGLGAALALTWFTDQVGALPALALLGWVLVCGTGTPRRRTAMLAITLSTILAITVPWVALRATSNSGSPLFLAKAQYVLQVTRHDKELIGGHMIRDTTTWERWRPLPMRALLEREAGLFRQAPTAYAHDVLFEFAHFFQPMPDRIQTANVYTSRPARWLVAVYFVPVLVFAVLAMFLGPLATRDRWLLALVPLSTATLYAFFFSQMRYRIPTEPHLILLGAAILSGVWAPDTRPRTQRT